FIGRLVDAAQGNGPARHTDHDARRDLEVEVFVAEPRHPSIDPARGHDVVILRELRLEPAHRRHPPLLWPPQKEVSQRRRDQDQPGNADRVHPCFLRTSAPGISGSNYHPAPVTERRGGYASAGTSKVRPRSAATASASRARRSPRLMRTWPRYAARGRLA